MSKQLFHAQKERSVIQKITFTGMMLSLVLLFQFLEKFMPLGFGYVNINITLLFILPVFYLNGFWYGVGVLLLRFGLGPLVSSGNYSTLNMVSQFVLLACESIAILYMFLFSHLFDFIKKHILKLVVISSATIIATSITAALLNGMLFTPLYWYVLGYIESPTISNAMEAYPYAKELYFFIPSYWPAMFGVYITANIIKFSIIYVAYIPMSFVFRELASRGTNSWA